MTVGAAKDGGYAYSAVSIRRGFVAGAPIDRGDLCVNCASGAQSYKLRSAPAGVYESDSPTNFMKSMSKIRNVEEATGCLVEDRPSQLLSLRCQFFRTSPCVAMLEPRIFQRLS